MKIKALTLLSLILLLGFSSQAQKVKEKDILGTWKLVIDVEEELEQDADEADTILEEIIINSISGVVSGILGNIDIYFEFKRDGQLFITAEAFGETEEEEGTWYINKRGYLVLEDIEDGDDFSISSDGDEWRLVDGILVNDDEDENVYMARVD